MIGKIILNIISLIFFTVSMFSQEKEVLFKEYFDQVKDTVTYKDKLENILNVVVIEKKSTISLNELNKIIELGEDIESSTGLGFAYRVKGELYKRRLEYDTAVENFEKAIAYFKQAGREKDIAKTYNDMCVAEYIRGNLEKSADYLLKGKKYLEQIKDSANLTFFNNNLGAIYFQLKDYKAAEKAFLQSYILQNKSDKSKVKGTILSNLGSIYLIQKDYKKAQDIVEKAIKYNRENEKIESLALSYGTLATIYMANNEFSNAKVFNDSALYFLRNDQSDITYLKAKQRSANIEFMLGNYKKAEQVLLSTRKAFNKINAKNNLLENYELSAVLDSIRGNPSGAIVWLKKHQKLSEKIIEEISEEQLESVEARYQAEIAQLNQIKEQEKKERNNGRELFIFKIFIFIIASVLLASLSFLFSVIKSRKERKQLITDLHNSNQIKNKLFSIISHDLKNEIFSLEASLNLMKDNKMDVSEFKKLVPLLVQRTHQTSILLNNLLNWSKSQMNELKAKPIDFDVNDVIIEKFKFFKPKATQKNIKLINKIEVAKIHADKDMVGIIVQNLIANAIKFCEPGDSIALVSREKNEFYEIGFQDTGIGIDPENIKKLFGEDTFSTVGTQNESGTGLGLKICKELVELNKGNIKVESTLGKGTIFYISFPKTAA